MTAMQQMRSSTAGSREKITWIVARKNIKGDPLTPSPLLLRCEETDTLARRAERLVVAIEHEKPEVPTQFMPKRIGSGIDVPCPLDFDFDPVDRVSVTAIRDYIACPYRFWLKHVLKLKVVEDCATELSPMLFGSLVHKAVEAFGKDGSINTSRNATEIRAYLSKSLDDVVQSRFGNNVSGMVRVQVEIARDRLLEVAVHQAESASEGWTILRSEVHYPKKVMIEGKPMTISGIIDRIDMHEDGRVRVLDYKTGGATANDAHFKKRDGQWIDLQLPLYRLLLSEVPELQGYDLGFENVSLGYFRIGDQEQNTGIDLLDLPLDVLASADDCIHSILLDIQNSNFGEFPTDPAPKYSDDLAWICQDNNITEEPKGDEL
jgi:hypothetical protein